MQTLASTYMCVLLHHCDCARYVQLPFECLLHAPAMFLRNSDCWVLKIAKSVWLMPIRTDIVTVNAHCHRDLISVALSNALNMAGHHAYTSFVAAYTSSSTWMGNAIGNTLREIAWPGDTAEATKCTSAASMTCSQSPPPRPLPQQNMERGCAKPFPPASYIAVLLRDASAFFVVPGALKDTNW